MSLIGAEWGGGLVAALACAAMMGRVWAGEPLQGSPDSQGLVTPRIQPAVITVGGPDADVQGFTSRAIQIAIDAVAHRGGGIVRLLPGRYEIQGPVRLASRVALVGSGPETILHKADGFRTRSTIDADYGMLVVTVADPSGFAPGVGVQIWDDAGLRNCWLVTTAIVTAVEGNRVYLDSPTVLDYQKERNGWVSTSTSVIQGIGVEDVRVANLIVDGNAEHNDRINGCRGGGIYFHKTRNAVVESVEVRNFNGDGISWQITEDVAVRNSEVHHCRNLGMHPGTGSDRSTVENCRIHDNGADGLFLCWRVQHGVFRNNEIWGNGRYGISIGHKDTDNLFEGNHVHHNALHGVFFRNEDEENAGNRNTFRNNVIEDNGAEEPAFAFWIRGHTRDILIEHNVLRDSGVGTQIGGIRIGAHAGPIEIRNNRYEGLKERVRRDAKEP